MSAISRPSQVTMNSFRYETEDHASKLADWLGSRELTQEHFGITSELRNTVEKVEYFISEEEDTTHETLAIKYGFTDVEQYKQALARCQMYNSYAASLRDSTDPPPFEVMSFMNFVYTKTKRFFPDAAIERPPASGCMLEYILRFDVEHLSAAGW